VFFSNINEVRKKETIEFNKMKLKRLRENLFSKIKNINRLLAKWWILNKSISTLFYLKKIHSKLITKIFGRELFLLVLLFVPVQTKKSRASICVIFWYRISAKYRLRFRRIFITNKPFQNYLLAKHIFAGFDKRESRAFGLFLSVISSYFNLNTGFCVSFFALNI
jgi:hypothetical protein